MMAPPMAKPQLSGVRSGCELFAPPIRWPKIEGAADPPMPCAIAKKYEMA